MPRSVSRYDEARLQGRLWTPAPLRLDGSAWWDFSDPSRVLLGAGGITRINSRYWDYPFLEEGVTAGMPDVGAINGIPAADFNSDSNRLLQGTGDASNTTPMANAFLVAMVFSYTASGSNPRFFSFLTSAGGADWNSSGSVAVLFGSGGTTLATYQSNASRASTSAPADTPCIFVVQSDGSSVYHYLNGAAGGSGALGTISLSTVRCALGAQENSFFTNSRMKFGEVVVLRNAQSTATRHRVEGYLAHKWRLASSLAGTHPHRNAPPLIGS